MKDLTFRVIDSKTSLFSVKNVFEAVSLIRPFAVDVSSGVEKASIKKDFEMIKEFVRQVGRADEAFLGKK